MVYHTFRYIDICYGIHNIGAHNINPAVVVCSFYIYSHLERRRPVIHVFTLAKQIDTGHPMWHPRNR